MSISCSAISISIFIGLKYELEIIIFWFGWPIKGVAFGLFEGALDGVNVQNIKSLPCSTYLYLIAFWELFVRFVITGSQKNDEVIIVNLF